MLGNIGKSINEVLKQSKEQEKISKAISKELGNAKMPPAAMKNIEKLLKTQNGLFGQIGKTLGGAEKMVKDVAGSMEKQSDGAQLQLLKELEKSINRQGEIVKQLIKNASK